MEKGFAKAKHRYIRETRGAARAEFTREGSKITGALEGKRGPPSKESQGGIKKYFKEEDKRKGG